MTEYETIESYWNLIKGTSPLGSGLHRAVGGGSRDSSDPAEAIDSTSQSDPAKADIKPPQIEYKAATIDDYAGMIDNALGADSFISFLEILKYDGIELRVYKTQVNLCRQGYQRVRFNESPLYERFRARLSEWDGLDSEITIRPPENRGLLLRLYWARKSEYTDDLDKEELEKLQYYISRLGAIAVRDAMNLAYKNAHRGGDDGRRLYYHAVCRNMISGNFPWLGGRAA